MSDGREQDTEPPNSIEAEQAFLGAILNLGEIPAAITGLLAPDDFFEPMHGDLFARFTEANDKGLRIDLKLTQAALSALGKTTLGAGNLNVNQYVARLAAEAVTVSAIGDYARVIADLSAKRKAATIAGDLKLFALSGGLGALDAADMIERAISELDAIRTTASHNHTERVTIAEAAQSSFERMSDALANPNAPSEITTGLTDIDRRTGGLRRGNLVIVGGRPGMGKTGVVVSVARRIAENDQPGLMFSLEMSAAELADRVLSDIAFDDGGQPIAYQSIASGQLTDADAERIGEAQRSLSDLPFVIDPQEALTVAQIAARARQHARRLARTGRRLAFVVVDHMQLVKASDRYKGNRVHELTEISGALKALAKELDCVVFALCQLNRRVEERDDKRPQLSDLRDSGSIEQDADLVLLLYRAAYYLAQSKFDDTTKEQDRVYALEQARNLLEINIAKQRNGPTGPVEVFFDPTANAARNWKRQ